MDTPVMTHPGTPRGCERIAYAIGFAETSLISDVYGGGGAIVGLDCHLIRPIDRPSDALIVFMHPVGGGMYLPMMRGLARAGHHVLYANSRYRGSDYALIMEKVAAGLGEAIVDAKTRLGYSKIVLAGWSGGGSLSMWYQALAEAGNGISETAAGDPYVVDPARMPAADPTNPNQPTYSSDFAARVKATLADIRASDNPSREFGFVVHGTMADPRWLDPEVDPNDRKPGICYLGDPEVVNDGPVGLARFSSLRSWLSQWSYDDARCDAISAGSAISVPILVVGNSADDACTPSHTQGLFDAVTHDEKRMHVVQGASHYYTGPDARAHLTESIGVVESFLSDCVGSK